MGSAQASDFLEKMAGSGQRTCCFSKKYLSPEYIAVLGKLCVIATTEKHREQELGKNRVNRVQNFARIFSLFLPYAVPYQMLDRSFQSEYDMLVAKAVFWPSIFQFVFRPGL